MRTTGRFLLLLLLTTTALVLALATGRQSEAGVFSLGIGSAMVPLGANATVALTANAVADDGTADGGPGDGIGSYQVDVAFDTANLTYVSCTAHPSGICMNPSFGVVRFMGASASGITGADVELGTVTLAASITVGTHLLDATIAVLADPQGTDIQGIVAGDGAITLTLPTMGDVDCSGGVNPVSAVDALKLLRYTIHLAITQNEPCSDIGTGGPPLRGDVDCDGDVDVVDSLKLLRYVAGDSVFQNEPCPDIGT